MQKMLLFGLLFTTLLCAETGHEAWLRYSSIDDVRVKQRYAAMPAAVVAFGDSDVIRSAREELLRGVGGMLGRTLRVEKSLPKERAILLGTVAEIRKAEPSIRITGELIEDGFWLKTVVANGQSCLVITGSNDRGVLYGTFAFLRRIALRETIAPLDEKQTPYALGESVGQPGRTH